MAIKKDDIPTFYYKPALQIIKQVEKLNHGVLFENGHLETTKARMKSGGNQFEVKIISNLFSDKKNQLIFGKSIKKVFFKTKLHSLILEQIHFGERSTNLISGLTNSFYSDGFSKSNKYWFRLIIPLEKEINFHYNIEQTRFLTDFGYFSRCGLSCYINDEILWAQVVHDQNKNYYLSIHSEKRQTLNSFKEKAFAIKNGFGYLTGQLAGNKGYFFCYDTNKLDIPNHFSFASFRKTISSYYLPVHINPYSWVSIPRKIAKKLYANKNINPVPTEVFSNLCKKLYESEDFTSVIILILESSVASLLFMPGGYAIALEKLSKIILDESCKKKLAPVNKSTMRSILKLISNIIDSYYLEIDEPTRSLLKNRIAQTNQPTNKAKLMAPFELLNLELNDADLQILDSRNNFLHGQIPDILGEGNSRSTERKNMDMYYSALRFHTLLNRLILKWVRFDGYILNLNRIYGYKLGIKLNEPYYIKV